MKTYKMEELIDIFTKHAENLDKMRRELGQEDDFDLPIALRSMCSEIRKLRVDVDQLKRKK